MIDQNPAASVRRGLAPRAEAGALLLACAVFLALASLRALDQTYPYFDDVAYLDLGNQVRALGGPWKLWGALFAGRFTEANRHPLYLALLSCFAKPDPAFHRQAQALSVALGLVALLSCWWVARRHLGRGAAAVLALFLAANGTFVAVAGRETCEPLLVAVWAQAVGAILDGARSPRGLAWWRAGFWAGLAYLTKGTGLFFPAVVGLTLLLDVGLRALVDRRAWSFGIAYAAASAPLWWRNLRVYGSPIYNTNSRYVWIDRLSDFAEVFAPHAQERLPRGALEYFSQLTPRALLDRLGMGFAETTFHFADAMALASPRPGAPLHVFWVAVGLLSALAALRWLWRSERGLARTFHLVHAGWTFPFLLFFNANGGSGRYFLPLAATTLAPALAAALVGAARRGPVAPSPWPWRAGIAWTAAVLAAVVLDPGPMRPPPGFLEVEDWLAHHLRPGDTYAVDARTHLQPRWLVVGARQVIVSASWREKPVSAEELVEHLRNERVRFVVLDGGAVADFARPGDAAGRRYLFYDRLPLEPDGSLPLGPMPDGMQPVYVDAGRPRRWMVLETAWAAGRPPLLAAPLPQ